MMPRIARSQVAAGTVAVLLWASSVASLDVPAKVTLNLETTVTLVGAKQPGQYANTVRFDFQKQLYSAMDGPYLPQCDSCYRFGLSCIDTCNKKEFEPDSFALKKLDIEPVSPLPAWGYAIRVYYKRAMEAPSATLIAQAAGVDASRLSCGYTTLSQAPGFALFSDTLETDMKKSKTECRSRLLRSVYFTVELELTPPAGTPPSGRDETFDFDLRLAGLLGAKAEVQ